MTTLEDRLADISEHAEAVGMKHPAHSDLNELGWAIYNLADCIRELAAGVSQP